MNSINIYSSESFSRSKRRYIIFSSFFCILIVLSILYENLVGAILLFFLLGGYLFFSISNTQQISMTLSQEWLKIWNNIRPRSRLNGYALEISPNTQEIHNIIILTSSSQKLIHTINDEPESISSFIIQLNEFLPVSNQITRTPLEKTTRILQL